MWSFQTLITSFICLTIVDAFPPKISHEKILKSLSKSQKQNLPETNPQTANKTEIDREIEAIRTVEQKYVLLLVLCHFAVKNTRCKI